MNPSSPTEDPKPPSAVGKWARRAVQWWLRCAGLAGDFWQGVCEDTSLALDQSLDVALVAWHWAVELPKRILDEGALYCGGLRPHFPAVVWLTLFFGSFIPILVQFGLNLWSRPQYQFFPLALVGVTWLAWLGYQEAKTPQPGSKAVAGLLLGGSLAMQWLALVIWSPWLGAAAAGLAGVALSWWRGGWPRLKSMLPALVLYLVIFPPPLSWDAVFTVWLREQVIIISSRLLDWLKIAHLTEGNVMEIAGRKLLVEEACSGINSLLSISATALFYGFWRRRPGPHIVLLTIGSMCFVLLANVIRILLGVGLLAHGVFNLLEGRAHDLLSAALFLLALGLMLSLDQLLFFFHEIPQDLGQPSVFSGDGDRSAIGDPWVPSRRAWWVAAVFVLVGLAGTGVFFRQRQFAQRQNGTANDRLKPNARFDLPRTLGGWNQVDLAGPVAKEYQNFNAQSLEWHFQKGDWLASVSLDYPFNHYHDVTVCYTLSGWTLSQKSMHPASVDRRAPSFLELELGKAGRHGRVLVATMNQAGRWLDEEYLGSKPSAPGNRLSDRFSSQVFFVPAVCTYRIQTLATSRNRLATNEGEELKRLFHQAREHLAAQLLIQMERP
jgi:exosortase